MKEMENGRSEKVKVEGRVKEDVIVKEMEMGRCEEDEKQEEKRRLEIVEVKKTKKNVHFRFRLLEW
jgi:hypothetical protein